MKTNLEQKAEQYLNHLCTVIGERPVGSPGNKKATEYFRNEVKSFGWDVNSYGFEAMDWNEEGAEIATGNNISNVLPGPYSIGCDVISELVHISTIDELRAANISGKILLLLGDISKEQLMPKNFVFYNPEEHREIVKLLENSGVKAIITATGRCSSTAGGVYPFPMIEDGDFNIPSVYMTEEDGKLLLKYVGETVHLISNAERINSEAFNVIASGKNSGAKKIVVTAHIDAKKGTPGAIDNATGVIVLMLLADLLKDYNGEYLIELTAFNGEDYYAVPGQMNYIKFNQDKFGDIKLNINIDGAGIKESKTDISFYNVPCNIKDLAVQAMNEFNNVKEGPQWPQGDHSIFVQYGVPAVAVSSSWLIEHMDNHDITHTPKDNPAIVDCKSVCEAALVIADFINKL